MCMWLCTYICMYVHLCAYLSGLRRLKCCYDKRFSVERAISTGLTLSGLSGPLGRPTAQRLAYKTLKFEAAFVLCFHFLSRFYCCALFGLFFGLLVFATYFKYL